MNNSPSRIPGLLAIIMGIAIVIGVVSYGLSSYSFDRTPLLAISAFLILVGELLNITLVWVLHLYLRARPPWFGQVALIAGMTGSLIALIGAAFDFLNTLLGYDLTTLFVLSQTRSIMAFGYGFLGIWLLLLNYQAQLHNRWSYRLAWSGMIVGAVLATGLLAAPRIFVPYVSLYHDLVPEIGELAGDLGWMLLYPIWSIWLGRVLLKDPYGGHQQSLLPRIQ